MKKRWLLALLPLVVNYQALAIVIDENTPAQHPGQRGNAQPTSSMPTPQGSKMPSGNPPSVTMPASNTAQGSSLPMPTASASSSNVLPMPGQPQHTVQAAQTSILPMPGQPHAVTTAPTSAAANPNEMQTIQIGGQAVQVPKDLSKLTPEQSRALIMQSKDLNQEQLEAVARSLDNPAAMTGSTPPPMEASGQVAAGAATQQTQQTPRTMAEMQRDDAFNALLGDVLPLSPDQITKLHKFYDLTLQAKATPPQAPPTPHFSSTVINLEPGSSPPVIRLAAGFVTSLLFVDSTGGPWPLSAYSIGDPQNFNIQWDQKSNALFIQSLKQYGHGNLAVRLTGLDTPIMITLVSGQKNVDFRVDLQVAGHRGPNAAPPVVDSTISANVNPILINLLDGVPPRNSIKLGVSGGHGEAWFADSRVYFRTRLTVLSPAWTATAASPDGTHVYELMQTPYILASQNGKTVDIKLSGL